MKYSIVALALAALVNAQTRDDIPQCAIGCLDDAITSSTSCKTTDYVCVCKNFDSLQGAATSCVIDKCGADVAVSKVLPAVDALCKAQGSAAPSTSEQAKPTETAKSSSSAAKSSSAAAGTTSGAVSIPESTAAATPSASKSASKTSNPTATQPAPTTAASTSPSAVPAGAAALGPVGAVALGALLLAL